MIFCMFKTCKEGTMYDHNQHNQLKQYINLKEKNYVNIFEYRSLENDSLCFLNIDHGPIECYASNQFFLRERICLNYCISHV